MRFRARALIVAVAVMLAPRAPPAWAQTSAVEARQPLGRINGEITDESGAPVAAARITLAHDGSLIHVEALSRADGRFAFVNVPAGPFRLTVSAAGFAVQTVSGVLAAGGTADLPPIRLTLALGNIGVDVTPARVEVAEQQLREQEQQRLLGILPNFRVSYRPDAVPLNPRQKFQLTWKSVVDPTRFAGVAIGAGIQHARNDFSGFGPGLDGYAKRYAALYGTIVTATMISNVLLPAVLKQDPRYFYKGSGTASSRLGYAVSRAVVRKGDNGRWQPDYSRILGHLASGAISNLYYPAENRRGARLTLENAAIGIGGAAAGNVMQEFLLKRLTTHAHKAP